MVPDAGPFPGKAATAVLPSLFQTQEPWLWHALAQVGGTAALQFAPDHAGGHTHWPADPSAFHPQAPCAHVSLHTGAVPAVTHVGPVQPARQEHEVALNEGLSHMHVPCTHAAAHFGPTRVAHAGPLKALAQVQASSVAADPATSAPPFLHTVRALQVTPSP